MGTFDDLVREVRAELADDFRARLRAKLVSQPADWLVDQLLAQCADANAIAVSRESDDDREARQQRILKLDLDETRVADLVARYADLDRDRLVRDGLLQGEPPPKGGREVRRSARLLRFAHVRP